MKTLRSALLIVGLVVVAFVAGSWITWVTSGRGQVQNSRKILYWIDPMHPSYKSDQPGIAPDCGMQLEPVYADEAGQPIVAGAVKVSNEKRQLIGVRVGAVESKPIERTIRTVGRVSVDESRLYRLMAPTEGVVRQVTTLASGSLVRKDDLLLSITSGEYDGRGRVRPVGAAQVYFSELDSMERLTKGKGAPDQLEAAKTTLQNAYDALANIGMSEYQIATLARTRKATPEIEVRSPVSGYIVDRNVSPRQLVAKGTELYRIADLGRVWILVDLFEQESRVLKPGMRVSFSPPFGQTRPIEARVGQALTQFDPESRTMKIRLEANNADYALRPGMFVDAEIPVSLPAAITVPSDAVVDSGLRKTVFVDRGGGYFEPRPVHTGARFDDQVEIVKGLSVGERIVLSSTFLLDSESRMKAAAMGISSPVRDPVCNMDVDEARAKAAGRTVTHRGHTYYFCSDDCREKFGKEPAKFATPDL
ncbi:MAG TPA: efflux RND transporter periplasmic adaptor subunit [Vicinamibacterales bacterium]|jgi:RND family efflux transporter MFP subunit